MKEIRYRLAKPSDAKQIAAIHYGIREQYDVGIFARLGKPFLRRYYSIMLNDPWEVVVCAEKEGRIMGFSSYTLDAAHQMAVYRKHRLALAFGALPSLIRRPSLIKLLWLRTLRSDSSPPQVRGANIGLGTPATKTLYPPWNWMKSPTAFFTR